MTITPSHPTLQTEPRELAREHRLPYLDLDQYDLDSKTLSRIPEEMVRRLKVLPLFEIEGKIYLATATPRDYSERDFLRRLTSSLVEFVLVTKAALDRAMNRYFKSEEKWDEAVSEFMDSKIEQSGQGEAVHIEDEEAPVIKMVNHILSQAVRLRASDVHLEPFRSRVLLRYRVDGVMHEFPPPPLESFRALVSRIKIPSKLDIAERRLPQDGRIRIKIANKECDLRVSVMPNLHGEGIVIRILDAEEAPKNLQTIGFSPAILERYKKIIRRPYGMILVTGPTGSGKSTTLYATLREIMTIEKKIITLEDPVESELYGATQIQVNAEIGYTFARGLRSVLRHDPDIILLGEIRDLETAEIAVRSSLTGHMVFSTLHTNDSLSAATRLMDMGIEPFLLFSSLAGVLAQRLVRRLCPNCKKEKRMSESDFSSLGLASTPDGVSCCAPSGCAACNDLGYAGRLAIGEFFEVTPKVRQAGGGGISAEDLKKIVTKQGFRTLRESALSALFAGVTSLDEVVNLTLLEEE